MVKIVFILVMVAAAENLAGQNPDKQLQVARKELEKGKNAEALKIASGILSKDSSYLNAYLFLADVYQQLDSAASEAAVLAAFDRHSPQGNPLVYYRAGKALYRIEKFGDASQWFAKYLSVSQPGASRYEEVKRLAGNCTFAREAMKNPVDFDPVRLNDAVNTDEDEYWPTISVDRNKLAFTRLIKPANGGRLPQEDFYMSTAGPDGWGMAKAISEINTSGNEGAQSLSADGRWLFFTACNRSNGFGSCDIFFSRFDGGSWSVPVPVRGLVNTSGWEGQPSVSADGQLLYFSSDRPGGKGKKDIWRSRLEKSDAEGIPVWSQPENLGDSVNTAGEEISPFIHPGGTDLFFASDQWPGMGGLDLFHVKLKSDLSWTAPQNLGYPLNTIKNEQGLVVDATGETAYFSSGRNKKTGMDIYSFKVDSRYRPAPVTYLKATVTDAESGNSVQAEVRLENLDTRASESFASDKSGQVFVCLPLGNDYGIQVSAEGYLFYSQNFPLREKHSAVDPYLIEIRLNRVKTGEKMNLYNLFFTTNSAELLSESYPELNSLYQLLAENPSLQVEIQGHTDNTGTREYNQALSEKRAQAVMDYLTSKGIQPQRLSSRGYGFDIPVAPNDTEEGRQQNRRTTILIK